MRRILSAGFLALLILPACGRRGVEPSPGPDGPYALDVRNLDGGPALRLVPVAQGFAEPWGFTFLPGGGLLVAEKGGTLRRVAADGRLLGTVEGVPAVASGGQGGLLDVALDPAFATNRRLYLAYAEPGTGAEAGLAGTAIFKAALSADGTTLTGGRVIFRQAPKVSGGGHFGCRLVFGREGHLFATLGERQKESPAQDLTGHLGKVVRLTTEGLPAPGNPDFGPGSRPELWTAGHRNPQAAALHPDTGELWIAEHGPQGGDEVNLALPGRNFGWPVVSYGSPYGLDGRIGGGVHAPAFTEPLAYWFPTSTAPGGMAFYTGDRFPEWRGNLFVGGLAGRALWRLVLDGRRVVGHQMLLPGQHQIRDLRQGPDGDLYLLTRDTQELLRLER